MARLSGEVVLRALDDDAMPVSGARLRVYVNGTSTPVTTYSDAGLTTPQTWPVVADSSGVFAPVYVPPGTYRVALATSADAALPGSPVDNIVAAETDASDLLVTPTGGVEDTLADHLAALDAGRFETPSMHASVTAAIAAGVTLIDQTTEVAGQVTLENGATVISKSGAWLKQTGWSDVGAFVTNVETGDDTAAGLTFFNPQIDLSAYPTFSTVEVASQSGTSVVLTSAASAADDYYNGRIVQVRTGSSAASIATVLDYVGSTRTLTLSTTITLTAGDTLAWGWNDNAMGFASGASDIQIFGGRFIGPGADVMVPAMSGQKGVGFERGVTRALVDGAHAENWEGAAFFAQGLTGGTATEIRFVNCTARNCGALLAVLGIDTGTDPDGEASDCTVIADNLTGHNVGHAPNRMAAGDNQKSGVIVCGEAQNVQIGTVTTRNDSGYPATWPAGGTNRVGSGLSGDIGAMFWGWGRRITIEKHTHQGDVDAVVRVARARALGEDAGATGQPRNCFDWDMNFDLFGACVYVLDVEAGSPSNVPADELSGYIKATVDSCTAFCGAGMGSFGLVTLDVTERATGKRVIGTPAQLVVRGLTFADYPEGLTDLRVMDRREITLADDTATSFTPVWPRGLMRFWLSAEASPASGVAGTVYYTTTGTATCEAAGGVGGNVEVGTAALTTGAGDGVDNKLNLAAVLSDEKIYVKNRLGASRTWIFEFPRS